MPSLGGRNSSKGPGSTKLSENDLSRAERKLLTELHAFALNASPSTLLVPILTILQVPECQCQSLQETFLGSLVRYPSSELTQHFICTSHIS